MESDRDAIRPLIKQRNRRKIGSLRRVLKSLLLLFDKNYGNMLVSVLIFLELVLQNNRKRIYALPADAVSRL